MNTKRWLIEYDISANVQHFVKTASAQGIRIIGVYPDALAFVAEGSEEDFLRWVATAAIRGSRSNAYPEEEIRQEENPHRRKVMTYWNQYLATSPQKSHPHEGLSWDHPGFTPPDRPEATSKDKPDDNYKSN